MTNGHMALEMAMQSMNLSGEVITTPFTFVSTVHAIKRTNLTPVFCDINENDFTIDVSKIESLINKHTCAIVPVHVFGRICNVEKLSEIAKKYDLKIIYDASHTFGATYKGEHIANFGDISTLSFHATKVFNTIEGGAVAFSNHKIYEKLYNLKNFGIRGEELVTEVGANAKMNEFSAIMGLCNLKHFKIELDERKTRYEAYMRELSFIKGIRFFDKNESATSNFAYFPIIIDDDFRMSRDELYTLLRENGVYARKYFYPLTSEQVCFKNKYKNVHLDVAKMLSKKVLLLPLYAD